MKAKDNFRDRADGDGELQGSGDNFFEKLIQRGLNYKEGIFFVIDGAKGIAKAIERIFSSIAIIQRCQYHKVENVISYLPKGMQRIWRVKLRAAYQETKYDSA